MFNKLIFGALICALSASFILAQTTDDNHKFEVFGGYSNDAVDVGRFSLSSYRNTLASRIAHHGFEASAVKTVNRYFGIKGDFSAHFQDINLSAPTATGATTFGNIKLNSSFYNFLGGVQIKDNRRDGSRFRPFAHALAGVAYGRTSVKSYSAGLCTASTASCNNLDANDTGFAAALGGGLDIKATNRLSVRAFQFDYNPARLNGTTQNNFRFSVGLVFH